MQCTDGDKFMKNTQRVWDNFWHMQKLRSAAGRWWFWVGLVALVLLALYLAGYLKWYAEGAKYRIQNQISNNYIAAQEAQQAALEAQYKNDPYGGATPEETLKLFIEALEKKDYTLASNYFLPEKRQEALGRMPEGVSSGGFDALVKAYRQGSVETVVNKNKSEIEIVSASELAPYLFQLTKNSFNNKWLISEL